MILTIAAIDDPSRLGPIQEELGTLEWRDGRATAGKTAKQVKRNEQAVLTSGAGAKLHDVLRDVIENHPIVKAAARPRAISRLMISKTRDDGHYGPHVDNAIMANGANPMRSDLSFTLFLNNAEDYEGGELVIHGSDQTKAIKGDAGQLVLYPSSSIHEVRPVTKGERVVCVGWIESMTPDPTQREILFDLENLRASMRGKFPAGSAELLTLDKSMANLLRMWARV